MDYARSAKAALICGVVGGLIALALVVMALGLTLVLGLFMAVASGGSTLPDPKLTPGCVLPVTAEQTCKPGYASSVRNVPDSVKHSVCLAYGIRQGCPGPAYEIDHLISLTLGGSNETCNLWPQPIAEALLKDHWERELHDRVCGLGGRPRITLPEAQKSILDASNWRAAPR